MVNCEMANEKEEIDYGIGIPVFRGKELNFHQYFFDSVQHMKMAEYGNDQINFKTYDGEIFQFRLMNFYNWDKRVLLLTSTLDDTFWFFNARPSIENTMRLVALTERRSYRGGEIYRGKFFYKLRDNLVKHIEERGIDLSTENLIKIRSRLRYITDKRRKHNAT